MFIKNHTDALNSKNNAVVNSTALLLGKEARFEGEDFEML